METISATLKQRKFANRGLVNGPFCVLYGLTAIAMTVGLQELQGNLAVYLCNGLCNSCRMGQWTSDRKKAFKARWWGLFKYQMEPGWIYLSSGFTIFGVCSVIWQ